MQQSGAVLTTTLYVGPMEIISASLRITKTYFYAGAQLVAMRVVTNAGGNTLYYVGGDHLGSMSFTASSTGALISKQSY